MTAFSNISQVIEALTTSGEHEHVPLWIDNRVDTAAATATIAGRLNSLWTYNKHPGGKGSAPGAVAAPTRSTSGAIAQVNASGGRENFLLGMEGCCLNSSGTLIIYDRLLHISGLSGTNTGAQTVAGSLTRNTGGVRNQIWVEIYTQIGTTATTITASYTNQAGTSSRTTQTTVFGGTNAREATRIIPLPLQDGDTGVQAVASVTVLATTGTAGNFGVTVAKPIIAIPFGVAAGGGYRDVIAGLPSIQKIDDDACLAFAWMAGSTTAPQVLGQLTFAQN